MTPEQLIVNSLGENRELQAAAAAAQALEVGAAEAPVATIKSKEEQEKEAKEEKAKKKAEAAAKKAAQPKRNADGYRICLEAYVKARGLKLWWDLFLLDAILGTVPVVQADLVDAKVWIAANFTIEVPTTSLHETFGYVARKTPIHPIKRMIESLPHDAVIRTATFASDYMGHTPGGLEDELCHRWFISAIARLYKPGSQADYMLVLLSPEQGKKKTSMFTLLGGGWCSTSHIPWGSKELGQHLRGAWIHCCDEMPTHRAGVDELKAGITQREDWGRAPYAHKHEKIERASVFGGTTNDRNFLVDKTGNRRFWVVEVLKKIDVVQLEAVVQQIWAEALAEYKAGVPWYISEENERAVAEHNQEYMAQSVLEEQTLSLLHKKVAISRATRQPVERMPLVAICKEIGLENPTAGQEKQVAQACAKANWGRLRESSGPRNWYYKYAGPQDAAGVALTPQTDPTADAAPATEKQSYVAGNFEFDDDAFVRGAQCQS